MNREEAKEYLPIIKAFAEGKTIQSKQTNASNKEWRDIEECNFLSIHSYRIKPEPEYRPFKTQEECWEEMHKHSDFGWIKYKNSKSYIQISYIGNNITLKTDYGYGFNYIFDNFLFTDGTPFGMKEE